MPERPSRPNPAPGGAPDAPGGTSPMDALQNMFGNMQDDRSRRRRNRPPEEEEDLQIDCLLKKKPDVTFADIGGNDEAKTELMEIVKAVKAPDTYKMFGANLPKGIMMTGKPGTGKTYMTGALANELKAPFYHVQVSNVVSMWFGQSEKNLQKIFDHAKRYCKGELDIDPETGLVTKWDPDEFATRREAELLEAQEAQASTEEVPPVQEGQQNRARVARRTRGVDIRAQIRQEIEARTAEMPNRHAVLFFDEIDALGSCRENTPFQGGVSNRIVSVLLENMDGLESECKMVVVASTNRVYAVDSALRRAGRFDRLIKIKKPDRATRAKILEIHAKKAEKRAAREFVQVNFPEIAMETPGMVGADMAEIVRKACQEQAKKYRDATPEDKAKFEFLTTEAVLESIKSYKINLRNKDPEGPKKGPIGFHASTKAEAEKEGVLVEEELDDDPEPESVPEPDENETEEEI